jgi:hypothetical protein
MSALVHEEEGFNNKAEGGSIENPLLLKADLEY